MSQYEEDSEVNAELLIESLGFVENDSNQEKETQRKYKKLHEEYTKKMIEEQNRELRCS